MTREDVPHVILTVFFGMVIFGAGRYSAPTPVAAPQVVYLHDAPAPPPSVLIITSAAPIPPPPVVAPAVTPVPSASVSAQPRVVVAPKPAVSAPVRPENIVLDETPEEAKNPYR